jgi:hypothetical protein
MLLAPASKAANIRSTAMKRPKNTTAFPYWKKRYRPISNRSSSRRMCRPYRRRKGKPSLRPITYPTPSPTIAPAAAASTTANDVDLTSGGGKKCRGNKDCLSGERHAGAFDRNNTKDDPRAVEWDQANQSIGQRSKLHLLNGRPRALSFNYHLSEPPTVLIAASILGSMVAAVARTMFEAT